MARGFAFDTLLAARRFRQAIVDVMPTETVTMVRGGRVVGTREQAARPPVIRRAADGRYYVPAERRLAALSGRTDGATIIPQLRDAVDLEDASEIERVEPAR